MNEGGVRRELYQALRYAYDLWPDHWPDIPGTKQPGRPDLVVMNPRGPGYYIECKVLDLGKATAFPFTAIEDSQRRWLDTWEEVRPGGAYLAVGTVGCTDRALYVIPWNSWLAVEEQLAPYQASLPFIAGKGYRIELQEQGLDFRLLAPWACLRLPPKRRLPKDSGWRLPPTTRIAQENVCLPSSPPTIASSASSSRPQQASFLET